VDERHQGGDKYLFYIVTTFVGGTPIKEISTQLTRDEELILARDLGILLGKLHRLKPKPHQLESAAFEWKKFIEKRYASVFVLKSLRASMNLLAFWGLLQVEILQELTLFRHFICEFINFS
jgi:hypothetical protein